MARTANTNTEVRNIVSTELDTAPFIAIAKHVVDKHLLDKGLDDDQLKQIEMFLAAHYVTLRETPVASEKLGDWTISYKNTYALLTGLASTFYGQAAIELDTTGTLVGLGRKEVRMEALV